MLVGRVWSSIYINPLPLLPLFHTGLMMCRIYRSPSIAPLPAHCADAVVTLLSQVDTLATKTRARLMSEALMDLKREKIDIGQYNEQVEHKAQVAHAPLPLRCTKLYKVTVSKSGHGLHDHLLDHASLRACKDELERAGFSYTVCCYQIAGQLLIVI